MNQLQDSQQRFKCGICNSTVYSTIKFRLHHRIHAIKNFFEDWKINYKRSRNFFKCNYCSTLIKREKNFLNHLTVHFEKQYHNCNFCERIFIGRNNLNIHLEKEHMSDEDKSSVRNDEQLNNCPSGVNKLNSSDNCDHNSKTNKEILQKKLNKKVIISIKRCKKIDKMAQKYRNPENGFEPTTSKTEINEIKKETYENHETKTKEVIRKKLMVQLEVIDIKSLTKSRIESELMNIRNPSNETETKNEEVSMESNQNEIHNISNDTQIIYKIISDENTEQIRVNSNSKKVENEILRIENYTESLQVPDDDDDDIQKINMSSEKSTVGIENIDINSEKEVNEILRTKSNITEFPQRLDCTQKSCDEITEQMNINEINLKEQVTSDNDMEKIEITEDNTENENDQILRTENPISDNIQESCDISEEEMEIVDLSLKEQEEENNMEEITITSMKITEDNTEKEKMQTSKIKNNMFEIMQTSDDDQKSCDENDEQINAVKANSILPTENNVDIVKCSDGAQEINKMLIKTIELNVVEEDMKFSRTENDQISDDIQNINEDSSEKEDTKEIEIVEISSKENEVMIGTKEKNIKINEIDIVQSNDDENLIKNTNKKVEAEMDSENMYVEVFVTQSDEELEMKTDELDHDLRTNVIENTNKSVEILDTELNFNYKNNSIGGKEDDSTNFREKFKDSFVKNSKPNDTNEKSINEYKSKSNNKFLKDNQVVLDENVNNTMEFCSIRSLGIENSKMNEYNMLAKNDSKNNGKEIMEKIFNLRKFSEKIQSLMNEQNDEKEIMSLDRKVGIKCSKENFDQQKRIKLDYPNFQRTSVIKKLNTSIAKDPSNNFNELFSTSSNNGNSLLKIQTETTNSDTKNTHEMTTSDIPIIDLVDDDEDSNTTSTIEMVNTIENREENTKAIDLTSSNIDYELEKIEILNQLQNNVMRFEDQLQKYNIPISLEDIIFLGTYEYVKEVSKYDFSEEQLKVIRLIRKNSRRVVNKRRKSLEKKLISSKSDYVAIGKSDIFPQSITNQSDNVKEKTDNLLQAHSQQQEKTKTWVPLSDIYPITIAFQHPQSGHEIKQQIPLVLNSDTSNNSANNVPVSSLQQPLYSVPCSTQNNPISVLSNPSEEFARNLNPINKLAVFNTISNPNSTNRNRESTENCNIENRLMQIVVDSEKRPMLSHRSASQSQCYIFNANMEIKVIPKQF